MVKADDGVLRDKPALVVQHASGFLTWLLPAHKGLPVIQTPQDWVGVYVAIKRRLLGVADKAQHPPWSESVQMWMQALAHDCEAAVDLLQAALEQEHVRRWQLEVSAFDARTELAQLRAELAGSRASELRARHQALHDSLTTLPNRHYFCLRLAQALEAVSLQPSMLAVFFVDLDGFKAVNDAHGHAAGDELLGIIAARLTRAIRSDDMVGRIGGDEFACLLMDIRDRQQLCRLACKVYDSVSAPIKLGELIISVRPSIGVAVYPDCGRSSDALLQSADMAMYRAKRDQTGYAFFDGE